MRGEGRARRSGLSKEDSGKILRKDNLLGGKEFGGDCYEPCKFSPFPACETPDELDIQQTE